MMLVPPTFWRASSSRRSGYPRRLLGRCWLAGLHPHGLYDDSARSLRAASPEPYDLSFSISDARYGLDSMDGGPQDHVGAAYLRSSCSRQPGTSCARAGVATFSSATVRSGQVKPHPQLLEVRLVQATRDYSKGADRPSRSARRNCAKAKRAIAAWPNWLPTGTGSRTRTGASPRYRARSWKCSASGSTPSWAKQVNPGWTAGTRRSARCFRQRSRTGSRSWISCLNRSPAMARGNSFG